MICSSSVEKVLSDTNDALSDRTLLTEAFYRSSDDFDRRVRLHSAHGTHPLSFHAWVLEHIRPWLGSMTLEVGAGSGQLWAEYARTQDTNGTIVASDLSMGMLDAARRKLCGAPRIRLLRCDATRLPFASECFEFVIANHMLYHTASPQQAILELARVLAPGGCLVASTTGPRQLLALQSLIQAFLRQQSSTFGRRDHLFNRLSFTTENGHQLLGAGFPSVTFHRYVDELVIDRAEHLLAWTLALTSRPVPASDAPALERFIQDRIRKEGPIVTQKDIGLFVATKATVADRVDA